MSPPPLKWVAKYPHVMYAPWGGRGMLPEGWPYEQIIFKDFQREKLVKNQIVKSLRNYVEVSNRMGIHFF